MLQKGQKLYSILFNKCPRCHEGDLYKKTFWQGLTDLLQGKYNMHERCSHCNLKYEQEPGFWWGAMYIGYMFSSGALMITAAICMLYFDLEVNETMFWVFIVACIGFLYNARLSRAVWINIYVAFKKDFLQKHEL
jgi:uncharacterized protein (DUF983 family)